MVWFCRWHFPSPGTDSCICSRLFSVLGVWFSLELQLRLELVLKVSGLGLGLGLVLVGLDVVWGWKIAPVMYICQSWTESNTKHLVLGFPVFYSVLLQTTLRSSAQLSKRSSTTVSVWANPAAVRRRLMSSSTFCIHGWSSGAGYASLNHRRPCFPRRQSMIWSNLPVDLCLSRTFTTFKTHLKSHLFNLSFPSVWLYHWLFLYSALEAACPAYGMPLNLSLLDYITLLPASNITVMCKKSGALNFMWPNETFM